MKYDIVESWLNNVAYSHSKNKNTPAHYRRAIELFCEFIGKKPEEIKAESESMDDRMFRRTYAQYIRAFIGELGGRDYSSGSVVGWVRAVKSFFKYNDLPLAYVPAGRPIVEYHNRDITREEIQTVLAFSNLRDKAAFCMMAQTGLRPETLCKLRLKHIEPDFSKDVIPCKVSIPQEIAKGQYRAYFTFTAEESVKYLKAYLQTRPPLKPDDYLFTLAGRNSNGASPKSLSNVFRNTLRMLQAKGTINYSIKVDKPSELRLYTLRKFFRKYANQAGWENVQFWMGHVLNTGQEEAYRPSDPEFHRQLYKEKAMPFLRFEVSTPDTFATQIQEKDARINALEQEMAELKKLVEELWENSKVTTRMDFQNKTKQ